MISIAERLERMSMPEPNSGCILWLGTVSSTSGHGRMKVHGRWESPHRVAYILAKGSVPDALNVCHRCDVPACINPAHLFVGTHRENMADMHAKGRYGRKSVRRPFIPHICECARCGVSFLKGRSIDKFCSDTCRWKVTRTPEQRALYNAARRIKRASERVATSRAVGE